MNVSIVLHTGYSFLALHFMSFNFPEFPKKFIAFETFQWKTDSQIQKFHILMTMASYFLSSNDDFIGK